MFDWLAAANVGRGLLHSRPRELVILRVGWRADAAARVSPATWAALERAFSPEWP